MANELDIISVSNAKKKKEKKERKNKRERTKYIIKEYLHWQNILLILYIAQLLQIIMKYTPRFSLATSQKKKNCQIATTQTCYNQLFQNPLYDWPNQILPIDSADGNYQ